MKIGLIDVDSHNFPNLALMKISAFHKARGDDVEWWVGLSHYDVVYKAKVFTDEYTQDEAHCIDAGQVIRGGTGYDITSRLPPAVESQYPDYLIYPNVQSAYGYLTRGCPRRCPFCIVAKKEGAQSKHVAALNSFWNEQAEIRLLDPNILACAGHERLLLSLVESGAWIDFTQGLDIRLVDSNNAGLLLQLKTKTLHFAWDNPKEDLTAKFQKWKNLSGRNHRELIVYVLTNYNTTHEEDLWRVYTLRDLGYNPFIMIYDKPSAPRKTRLLQQWVNNRRIFWSVGKFEDFDRKRKRRELIGSNTLRT